MIFSKIQIAIALVLGTAALVTIGGLVWYARNADAALTREQKKVAVLEGAVGRLNATVQRYDEQRAEDQRRLDALAARERDRTRELERIRGEYDRLLAGLAQRVKADPAGLASELRERLGDLLQRTGEPARRRGADETDRGAASGPPGAVPGGRGAGDRDPRPRRRGVDRDRRRRLGRAHEGARMPGGLSRGARGARRPLSSRA